MVCLRCYGAKSGISPRAEEKIRPGRILEKVPGASAQDNNPTLPEKEARPPKGLEAEESHSGCGEHVLRPVNFGNETFIVEDAPPAKKRPAPRPKLTDRARMKAYEIYLKIRYPGLPLKEAFLIDQGLPR